MREKLVLEKARKDGLALTYQDVRLRTGYSSVMPDEVNLNTMFSRNVPLKIPIVSAAMDSVTEANLATELAKLGGIGVIHRGLSPEEQAKHVARVKNHLNGRIEHPIRFSVDDTIEKILHIREEKGYTFHSFPIVNEHGKLRGILTENDFDFCQDPSLPAGKVMTSNPLTAPQKTDMRKAYEIMMQGKKKSLPLINENGEVAGMYVFNDVRRIITGKADMYNTDTHGQLRVAAAIGTGEDVLDHVALLVQENVDAVVIDTAHAYSYLVLETLRKVKKAHPDLDVVVGNISTGDAAKALVENGADGIKIGQGPGSICTTRMVAGIGRPQVSAIYDCARALGEKNYDVPLCADGGLKYSGDIPVAIAAGAHSVMMGSMLAGTEEAPGEVLFLNGNQVKIYRGMGSLGAMQSSNASRERYNQKSTGKNQIVPEGVEGAVPYKGKLADVMTQYVGGLQKGMGYVGAKTIDELRIKSEFDRITGAGLAESNPHSIMITKEAPNWRG